MISAFRHTTETLNFPNECCGTIPGAMRLNNNPILANCILARNTVRAHAIRTFCLSIYHACVYICGCSRLILVLPGSMELCFVSSTLYSFLFQRGRKLINYIFKNRPRNTRIVVQQCEWVITVHDSMYTHSFSQLSHL